MVKKFEKFLIPIVIVVGVLIIAGVFIFVNRKEGKSPISEGALSPQQIAEKAINFINQNFVPEGTTASLIDITEEGEVYKIRLKVGETEYESYVTRDGKFLFPEAYDLEETSSSEEKQEETLTIGNFLISNEEICRENGKPIIYFFGSESCSHCRWEHPVVEEVTEKFGGYILFHNNIDSQEDMDIFYQYSTGSIPTLVLGCKYYRVGSGERAGQETESNNLTALICKLTGNQPANICNSVQDLINQIER